MTRLPLSEIVQLIGLLVGIQVALTALASGLALEFLKRSLKEVEQRMTKAEEDAASIRASLEDIERDLQITSFRAERVSDLGHVLHRGLAATFTYAHHIALEVFEAHPLLAKARSIRLRVLGEAFRASQYLDLAHPNPLDVRRAIQTIENRFPDRRTIRALEDGAIPVCIAAELRAEMATARGRVAQEMDRRIAAGG